VRRVVPKPETS